MRIGSVKRTNSLTVGYEKSQISSVHSFSDTDQRIFV